MHLVGCGWRVPAPVPGFSVRSFFGLQMSPHPVLFPALLACACLPSAAVASAGGAPSIFIQAMDMIPLTISLAIIITLTIVFEVVLHQLKHKYERDPIARAVVNKINAEFTVLGFVSIIVVLLLNAGFPEAMGWSNHVPEFEVAHVWLFMVGCVYVVEALVFLRQAVRVSQTYTEFNLESNTHLVHVLRRVRVQHKRHCCQNYCVLLAQQLMWRFRDCCGCCQCCHKSAASGRPEDAAAHVMRGFFFEQAAHSRIVSEMGRSRAVLFDFSTYMTQFWKREIVTCLEISPLSWLGFFLIVWCLGVFIPRQLILNFSRDLSMIGQSLIITPSLALFFGIFVAAVVRDASRLDRIVARVVTGDDSKSTVYDAVEHLVRISDDKETLDWAGHNWPQPEEEPEHDGTRLGRHGSGHDASADDDVADIGSVELISPITGVHSTDGVDATDAADATDDTDDTDDTENGIASNDLNNFDDKTIGDSHGTDLDESKERERKATLGRLRRVVLTDKKLLFSSRWRQTIFSIMLFAHSYTFGMILFLVVPDADNMQQILGTVSLAHGSNNSSHTAKNSDTDTDTDGNRHRRDLAASSIGSHGASWSEVPRWGTCKEFAAAGTQYIRKGTLDGHQYKISNFQNVKGDDRYCTVNSNDPRTWILRLILWVVPALITTFVTIPLFLGSHAHLKAIGDLWHLSQAGTEHSHPRGRCCRDDHGMGGHGHGGSHGDSSGQSHSHGHGTGHSSPCSEFLFGTNFTNFGEILKDVCDKCNERHRILMQIRSHILLALKLFPEGMSDLVERTGVGAGGARGGKEEEKDIQAHTRQQSKLSGLARIGQQVLRVKLFAGKPPEEERELSDELANMWVADEERGSPRFIQLVREFLNFLSNSAAHRASPTAETESPPIELPIGLCLFGINLLLKYRLPESAGIPLSAKMEHALSQWLDHNHDGAVSLTEFTEFLVPPLSEGRVNTKGCNSVARRGSLITLAKKGSRKFQQLSPTSDSTKGEVAILRERLRLQTMRTRELEQQLTQLTGGEKAKG